MFSNSRIRKLEKALKSKHIQEANEDENKSNIPEPQPKQVEFLESEADIVLCGGGAGGGKSQAILLDNVQPRFINTPGYQSVIFRRTFPELKAPGGLWSESLRLYPLFGGIPHKTEFRWYFPSGATVTFAAMQHESDMYRWQGAQLTRVSFDEATLFEASQVEYLQSRMRSPTGIKPQMRWSCNPDAGSWLRDWVEWWVGEDGYPIPERSGVLRWFVKRGEKRHWADTRKELIEKFPGSRPKSFTFIPSTIHDNPALLEINPDYLTELESLHPVDVERLLRGNWDIQFGGGSIYNREWFTYSERPFHKYHDIIRFWDFATTAAERNADAFYTVGVLMARLGSEYMILDVVAQQLDPSPANALFVAIAIQDGIRVRQAWELEGGSAGQRLANFLQRELEKEGLQGYAVRPKGDKLARAIPVATEAKNGHVSVMVADWNDRILNALHNFDGTPTPLNADVSDALAGAYEEIRYRDIPAFGSSTSTMGW